METGGIRDGLLKGGMKGCKTEKKRRGPEQERVYIANTMLAVIKMIF